MSIITSVTPGPALYKLMPPVGEPAGTIAALETISPSGSFTVATTGLVEPDGQSVT